MGRFCEGSTVDPKKNCAGHIEYRNYAIRIINSVGLNAIRVYATTKPHPVKDFEKVFQIARYSILHGSSACVTKFSCSRQYADYCMRRLVKLAEELKKKEAE